MITINQNKKFKNIIFYFIGVLCLCTLGVIIGNKLFYISIENNNVYAYYGKDNDILDKSLTLSNDSDNVYKSHTLLGGKGNISNKHYSIKKVDKDKEEVIGFEGEKICYLTFDDGPTRNITPEILEILKEKNVRATFFVLGKLAEANRDLVKRERNEGHLVANHTYSHDYKYIYSDPNNLIKDLNKNYEILKNILEEEPCKIVRFPGGSFNKKGFQKKVNEAGYDFVDWNCLNGDAEALNVPEEKLFNNVKNSMGSQRHLIILMHDASTKQTTVRSLGRIIDYIKEKGYEFKTLDEAIME